MGGGPALEPAEALSLASASKVTTGYAREGPCPMPRITVLSALGESQRQIERSCRNGRTPPPPHPGRATSPFRAGQQARPDLRTLKCRTLRSGQVPRRGTNAPVRFATGLFDEDALRSALEAHLNAPPRQLPPSSVSPALLSRPDEVPAWVLARLRGDFLPTREEIVHVSKPRHGLRPVAVWDLPSSLAYASLTDRLRSLLPPVERGRASWKSFQAAPLDEIGKYVVASDIVACYEHIDHGLLAEELLVQTSEHDVVDGLASLLAGTSGRRFGLPQQSVSSDLLAETFMRKLDRALTRRGLRLWRYNDDYRFICAGWTDVIRTIEVLTEEARLLGLTVNDMKTITWGRQRYTDHLDEVEGLRREIAEEAELDLTDFDADEYDGTIMITMPAKADVELRSAVRVLERWQPLTGRGSLSAKRSAEHRAVLELLPLALRTLEAAQDTHAEVLATCMKLLRYEQTMTPAVAAYLTSRSGEEAMILGAFDKLLASSAYLNGWQTWWLQQPVARLDHFATGAGSRRRLSWAREALTAADHSPVLRAHAALTLARHGKIASRELMSTFTRSSEIVRPVLAAAVALLKPERDVQDAVTGSSPLDRWTYEWAATFA